MVKLNGPLHSLEARGSVGDALTYSQRKSGAQVRFQRKQKDVFTSARERQRGYFSSACGWWNTLTSDEQAEFETLSHEI